MKTFDEVTKALSICGRHPDCKGCPYENISYPTEIGNTCKDVMHYDALYYMQDRIDECQEANPALTWEELKGMEGKPVWVEESADNGLWWTYWVIWQDENAVLPEKTYGTAWQAYRKERS